MNIQTVTSLLLLNRVLDSRLSFKTELTSQLLFACAECTYKITRNFLLLRYRRWQYCAFYNWWTVDTHESFENTQPNVFLKSFH